MNKQLVLQQRFQHFMVANGMIYSLVQVALLVYAGVFILPVLGHPADPVDVRYNAYATYGTRLRIGNYLWAIPPVFFFIFLGGIYVYFNRLHESVRGILFSVLLSGTALIMIWPIGAIISILGVDIAGMGGDKVTGWAFDSIVPYSLGLSTVPRAVFLICLSVLLIGERSLAIPGLIIAGLSLCGTLVLVSGNFLPFSLGSALLFYVWTFLVSLHMFRTRCALLRAIAITTSD